MIDRESSCLHKEGSQEPMGPLAEVTAKQLVTTIIAFLMPRLESCMLQVIVSHLSTVDSALQQCLSATASVVLGLAWRQCISLARSSVPQDGLSNFEAFVACRNGSELSLKCCLEAASILSALTAADAEFSFCGQMLEAGPLLIAHLSGGMGWATAEQSAWVLGTFNVPEWPKPEVPAQNEYDNIQHEQDMAARSLTTPADMSSK